MEIEIKDYDTVVEFPDDMDEKEIQKVLAREFPPKTKPLNTGVAILKNVWEGIKEGIGGTIQGLAENPEAKTSSVLGDRFSHPNYDTQTYYKLAETLQKEDERKLRRLGLKPRPFGYYFFNSDFSKQVEDYYEKQEQQRLKPAATAGQQIVKQSIEAQQQNLKRANAKPGSGKEFFINISAGFGENIIPTVVTAATKNPVPLLTSTGLISYGKTYGEARLEGATKEAAMLAAYTNGTVDVTMNLIPVGEIFKPSNNIIKSVIKQARLEVTYNAIASLLKSGVEKGTIKPDMTLPEALKAAGLQAGTAGFTGGMGKFLNLTIFKAPQPEPKLVQKVAQETIWSKASKNLEKAARGENFLAPELEPRPLTKKDFQDIATGKIEAPTNDDPDTILPKHIETSTPQEKTRQTWTNTIHKDIPEEVINDYLPEEKFKYTPETITGEIETAKNNLKTDRVGTIKRLEDAKLIDSGTQVMELGVLIKEAEKNNDDVNLLKYTQLLAEKGTEYGRGLRAMQDTLKDNQTPEGAVLTAQKTIKKVKDTVLKTEKDLKKKDVLAKKLDEALKISPEDSKYIRERMAKAQRAKTPIERQYYLYDIEKRIQTTITRVSGNHKFLRALVDYTTGNILWSPDTILWSNLTGNISRLAKNSFDWFLHGSIHWLGTKGDASVIRIAQAKGMGYLEGIKQIYKLKDTFNELRTIHKQDKLENPTQDFGEWLQDFVQFKKKAKEFLTSDPGSLVRDKINYSIKYLGSDPLSKETSEALTGVMLDTFGQVHGLNYDLMEGVDTVQKYLAYFAEARGEIHRQTELAKFIDLAERDKFENDLWNDFLDSTNGKKDFDAQRAELLEAIHLQAKEEGRNSSWKGAIPEALQTLNKDGFWGSLFKLGINKFITTPANMLKYNVQQLPIVDLLKKTMREDLLGKNGVEAQTKAVAKQVSGFLLYGGVYTVASAAVSPLENIKTCNLTGGHPPEKRKALIEAGIPEYSFKGPDGKWHSYRRYEPFATILSSMMTAQEYWQYYTAAEKEEATINWTTALASLDAITSSTMLKGIKDFIDSIDPKKAKQLAGGTSPYVLNQERSFLPFSSLFTAIQKGTVGIGKHPTILEVRNWTDQINAVYAPDKARPKLSAISGREIQNEGTFLGSTIDHTEIDQPALLKIAQLDMNIAEPSSKPFGVQLNDKEYWEYRRSLDTEFHFLDKLNAIVSNPSFQDQSAGLQKMRLQAEINGIRTQAAFKYLQKVERTKEIWGLGQQKFKKLMKPIDTL
jgi:hypothetical protein